MRNHWLKAVQYLLAKEYGLQVVDRKGSSVIAFDKEGNIHLFKEMLDWDIDRLTPLAEEEIKERTPWNHTGAIIAIDDPKGYSLKVVVRRSGMINPKEGMEKMHKALKKVWGYD